VPLIISPPSERSRRIGIWRKRESP